MPATNLGQAHVCRMATPSEARLNDWWRSRTGPPVPRLVPQISVASPSAAKRTGRRLTYLGELLLFEQPVEASHDGGHPGDRVDVTPHLGRQPHAVADRAGHDVRSVLDVGAPEQMEPIVG